MNNRLTVSDLILYSALLILKRRFIGVKASLYWY